MNIQKKSITHNRTNGMQYLKIFVEEAGKPSIKLLSYLNDNIIFINEMGAKIKISRIRDCDLDSTIVDKLRQNKIYRFPALVTPHGKIHLGVEKIQNYFETHKQKRQQSLLHNPTKTNEQLNANSFHEDPLLGKFWYSEMNKEAMKRDQGRDEVESHFETGSGSNDLQKRVNDQMLLRKRTPASRAMNENPEQMENKVSTRNRPRKRQPDNSANNLEDNYDPSQQNKPTQTLNNEDEEIIMQGSDASFDAKFLEQMGGGDIDIKSMMQI